MIGVISDTAAILLGGTIGFLAKKIIPESWNDIILKGLGLCSIYIGIAGTLEGNNTLILIMAMVFGAMMGEGFRIEQRFNGFAERLEKKFDSRGGKSNFAQGFITSSLMMCVGAMSIVGSLNAGLKGDNTLLFTKTAMDGVGAMMFAASLGMGVIFSSITVFLFEGAIVLLAGVVAPALTSDVINMMTCVGSLIIIAMGLNLVADTKLKIMNYMPAVFLPIAFCPLYDWILAMVQG